MIEISQIRMACGKDREEREERLRRSIRKSLHLQDGESFSWRITRHSVDARKKPELFDVYSVEVTLDRVEAEERILKDRKHGREGSSGKIRRAEAVLYRFPAAPSDAPVLPGRPVIIGFGPAGIFCSLMLARNGFRPIVLERGERMEDRLLSVKRFWETGELNPESNIQFGEGGAGTFSDGKLNSNVKDRSGRIQEVIRTFLAAGAPEDIAYEQIPHIGTDCLRGVIRNIREEICSLGGEIRFCSKAERLITEGGRITGVEVCTAAQDGVSPSGSLERRSKTERYILETPAVVLAPGHSARDTVRTLLAERVPMESKPFAVGFRVSHPQSLINRSQLGVAGGDDMRRLHLAPANYKLTARAQDGHGVYSFCMCPGGYVVNASSEPGRLAVNGMSNYLRDSDRANSAIVMTVGPEEFGGTEVLDGCRFQEKLEERAFRLCGGRVPVQRFASFEEGREDSVLPSSEELCIRGSSAPGRLDTLLPENLTRDFEEGMRAFGHKIEGFDGPEAYVIGLESRTSSPVRILRDENGESPVKGLYPCGEGAGFAGGITSAAVDGIRIAESIGKRYRVPK